MAERFWEKVDTSGECWLWTAATTRRGYGRMGLGGAKDGYSETHRVSWMLHYGPIPEGLFVCHKCDVPGCVRPDHLFLGTAKDNSRDMWAKGRGRTPTVNSLRHTSAPKTGAASPE